MSNVHSCGLLELRGGGGEPVDFTRTVSSHGVAALPPSMISRGGRAFGTTLDLGSKRAQTVFVRRIPSGHLRVTSLGTVLEPRQQARVLNSLRAMLCLEDNLVAFYELAAADRDLSWVLSGAGRMLRSPTVFEDVVKTICTTNCAWSATVRMVTSLVRCLGKPDYRGRRAFPTPAAMAAAGDAFYRDTSRAGYRGAYLLKLARAVADGSLDLEGLRDRALPDAEVERRLLAIPGVGPYAQAHIMLTSLGRYGRLVLDSWTVPTWARLSGQDPSRAAIEARFNRYQQYRGLAFWLYLTRQRLTEGGRPAPPEQE